VLVLIMILLSSCSLDNNNTGVMGQAAGNNNMNSMNFQQMMQHAQNLLMNAHQLKQSSNNGNRSEYEIGTAIQNAKQAFWASIQKYDGKSVQLLQAAMQGYLQCFALEGDVAMGFVSIAEAMFRQGDHLQAKNFLVQGLQVNPKHEAGLNLAKMMGLSNVSEVLDDERDKQNRVFRKASSSGSNSSTPRYRTNLPPEACSNANECAKVVTNTGNNSDPLENGWDASAHKLYQTQLSQIKSLPTMQVSFPVRNQGQQKNVFNGFTVSELGWWDRINEGTWESETLDVFDQYVSPDTTVVDFGAWIGPTIFYTAQIAKRVIAIEADPHAFASLERNLALNAGQAWSSKVTLESVCVSTPNDTGVMTMKSADAGNSCSSLGENVEWACGGVKEEWQVRCYTLPYLFAQRGITIDPRSPVFIKVDIESYECALIPSFYDWLVGEKFLPTIFVSFHPQITLCDEEQLRGVMKVLKLYEHVSCEAGKRPLKLSPTNSFGDFQEQLIANGCFQSSEYSDFVLNGRAGDPSWLKQFL